ncbi:MAG TPA: YihY/virulence factor BrkB family protein [Acidobacteriaceae bacterium]|nr:YihY/virulence factor BrkB family protein [Acidobacteriaceae bacterium]
MSNQNSSRIFSGLTLCDLAVQTFHGIGDDDLTGRSAELAYFFFLAIFPGFLFLTAVLGMLSGPGTALRSSLMHYLPQVVPPQAWSILQDAFTHTSKAASGGKLSFGVIAALWSATAGMSAMCDTLNGVHDIKESRPYWKVQATALGLTLTVGVLLLFALTVLFSGDAVLRLSLHSSLRGPIMILAKAVQWTVLCVCVTLSFALTYYWAPDIKEREWHWITPGAAFGIVLWILATIGLRLYLHFNDTYSATYGTVGAVIILLLWFYISGFALLIGAEVNAAIEDAAARQGTPGAVPKGEKYPTGHERIA